MVNYQVIGPIGFGYGHLASSLSNYLNIPVWSVDDVACYDADAMVRQCDGDGDTVKTRWQWCDGMTI